MTYLGIRRPLVSRAAGVAALLQLLPHALHAVVLLAATSLSWPLFLLLLLLKLHSKWLFSLPGIRFFPVATMTIVKAQTGHAQRHCQGLRWESPRSPEMARFTQAWPGQCNDPKPPPKEQQKLAQLRTSAPVREGMHE